MTFLEIDPTSLPAQRIFRGRFLLCILICLLSFGMMPSARAVEVDPALPDYQPRADLKGHLTSMGSDVLNNLVIFWGEAFQVMHPEVTVEIRGKGSVTALWGLTKGGADLGPMTRIMNDKEAADFTAHWGYPPKAIAVAFDALALVVHADNPLPALTLVQVDGIFSSTRRRGSPALTTWGDLGLTDPWASLSIVMAGRNSASGSYGFFKSVALSRGDFLTSVQELPGTNATVQYIKDNRNGIGYAQVGFAGEHVRIVPIGETIEDAVLPTPATIRSGTYPLGRNLYLYFHSKPGEPNQVIIEFLRFILSKPGQAVVAKDGLIPLDAAFVQEQAKSLD